jgi:hypothetical protein
MGKLCPRACIRKISNILKFFELYLKITYFKTNLEDKELQETLHNPRTILEPKFLTSHTPIERSR